jgi:hypothetical protein
MYASVNNHALAVKALLEAGADVQRVDFWVRKRLGRPMEVSLSVAFFCP